MAPKLAKAHLMLDRSLQQTRGPRGAQGSMG